MFSSAIAKKASTLASKDTAMNSIYLVGDNSDERNQFNKPWRTGSTRVRNRQFQILVNEDANYGGGSGPIWATEGAYARLTLRSGGPYISGVCTKVHGSSLAIEFAIHDSPYTWGKYVIGQVVVLSIFDISRYDSYTIRNFTAKSVPAPRPIPVQAIHNWMMSSLETELKNQFESEVSPNLTKALINSVQSLKQYSARYLGTEEHSGHDYASHAKRTFHKSMRHLIGLLEKDGLDKYLTPGQKQIALNTVKN